MRRVIAIVSIVAGALTGLLYIIGWASEKGYDRGYFDGSHGVPHTRDVF